MERNASRQVEPASNTTAFRFWTYATEQAFHEMLLQSRHRTFDPEEADLFYIPAYLGCYAWPMYGWLNFPFFNATGATSRPPGDQRAHNMAYMAVAAKRWAAQRYPFWNRTGGADHFMLFDHDEGSCYVPGELRPMILLSHWGRMDAEHRSNTAYGSDDYSTPRAWPGAEGYKHLELLADTQGWSCFDPAKDIVIPTFKSVESWSSSLLAGVEPRKRDILLFMRGDVGGGGRLPNYSRSIRQAFARLSSDGLPAAVANAAGGAGDRPTDESWSIRYRIQIGTSGDFPGDYAELLSRSLFCLIAPGDGWSPRAEDAVPHGCIPLLVMDNVSAILQPHLDWPSFSVRIAEVDIPNTPQILLSLPPAHIRELQANLAKVWHRFMYSSGPSAMVPVIQDRRARNRAVAAAQRKGSRRQLRELADAAHASSLGHPLPSSASEDAAGDTDSRVECGCHSPHADASTAPAAATRAILPTAAQQASDGLTTDSDIEDPRDSDPSIQNAAEDFDAWELSEGGAQHTQAAAEAAGARSISRALQADKAPPVLDQELQTLLAAVNAEPLALAASDGTHDGDDAFNTIMQILVGRVESLKLGDVVLSERAPLRPPQ